MFRRIDGITLTLVLIIAGFIVTLSYLYAKNQDEQNFAHYHNQFELLKLLQKDYETFLHTSLDFKNYDDISTQLLEFDSILLELEESRIASIYGEEIQKNIKKIRLAYTDEVDLLEYHKSINAMTVNTIHYLFDLRKSIAESKEISEIEKQEVNELLFLLMQRFSGVDSQDDLFNKLVLKNRFNSNKNLNYFYEQSKIFIENIANLQLPLKEHQEIALFAKITKVMLLLEKRNTATVQRNEKLNILFALGLILLLSILIYLHHRSLAQKEHMKLTATVFNNVEEGIVVTDAKQSILSINKAFETMLGYTSADCIGNKPTIFQSKLHNSHFYERMWYDISEKGVWQGKIKDRAKDGTILNIWLSISVVKDIHGNIINYIAIHTNLEDIIKSQERIDFLAYHDSLTKLPNRVNFEESINHSIKLAKRHKTKLAILFIDLDRFKIINDTLGHHVGDELLKDVAKRIRAVLRDVDMLARVGGDEFVVTLENIASMEEPSNVANKILHTLSQPIKALGHTLNTSASIGIACYPVNATDVVTLVKYADSAMYRAKDLGKNRMNFFTEELSSEMKVRLEIEQELRKAITKKELYLNFQPQYNLVSKKIVSAEALLRWKNEKLGIVGPDVFIPIAEESGLILEIGDFVFRESCAFMKEVRERGYKLERIAINVSSQQFGELGVVNKFKNFVREHGLTPDLIEIEITERYIMESTTGNLTILDELRESGFKISIDDFGTGYSSMSYLKTLPLNTLKIDKSFVDDLPTDTSNVAITKAIISLANNLGYETVAEGIETIEQEDFLTNNLCKIGQGYLFSRPLDKQKIFEFMDMHRV